MKKGRFSVQELRYIKEHGAIESLEEISSKLDRRPDAIQKQARMYGISMQRKEEKK